VSLRIEKETDMKIIKRVREYIVEDSKDFESGHASTLIELANRDILAAWFGGSWEGAPDVAIWTAKRVDGVWQRPKMTTDQRGVACWNPVLFTRKDGTIQLYYKVGVKISEWRTWLVESKDQGESWSSPVELVEGDRMGGRGPVKNKPIYRSDGAILAPASLEGETWDAFVDISCDEGESWEMSSLVPLRRVGYNEASLHTPYNRYHCYGKGVIQPTLWEDELGDIHMLLRSTSSRIFRSDSKDGGRTWCTAYATELPNNNSGIDLVRLPSGILVLAYNPRENAPNYYKGSRTPLVLSYSEDNGNTWQLLDLLEDGKGTFAYPAIICNEQNEILVTYTWNRLRIVFCKLTYELN